MTYQDVTEQLQLLPDYLGNHLLLTLLALAIGIIVCVPLGCLVTRVKPLQWPVLTAAGVLQTIPGIALLALMVPLLGRIGFVPALLALILYSFLPILRNTVTGILGVDRSVVEAARGIGMTDKQTLINIEIPLALPVLIAGIRTAAVWVVGTATLATPVGATSLGNYVFSGLQTQNLSAIVVGCVAAATLAIVLDQLIRLVEKAASRRSLKLGIIAGLGLVLLIGGGLAPMTIQNQRDGNSEPVVIGSKPFTEQYILAGLIVNELTLAGLECDTRPGMGSIILFEALAQNAVDCYVDYGGTIWANVMKRSEIPPRDEMLREITTLLKQEYGIVCLGALGFENTYALATRREDAERFGLSSIGDLAPVAGELSMSSDYEFFSRPEWKAIKKKYDLNFKKLITIDPTLMYSAIAQREVDVISAYSTDGRIVDNDLQVLTDPKQALPPYDAIILLSPKAAMRTKLVAQLQGLVGKIDNEAMRQTNKLVDVDGLSVDSAVSFLGRIVRSGAANHEVNQ